MRYKIVDQEEAEDESEDIVTKAIISRLRTKKKKGKDRSPSKVADTNTKNTNLLAKPKNDDSSESSSIKDSGYEEPENAATTKTNKEKLKSKGSTDSLKKVKGDKGSSISLNGDRRKASKQEVDHQSPPPAVFNLHEINSIWATCDGDEEKK